MYRSTLGQCHWYRYWPYRACLGCHPQSVTPRSHTLYARVMHASVFRRLSTESTEKVSQTRLSTSHSSRPWHFLSLGTCCKYRRSRYPGAGERGITADRLGLGLLGVEEGRIKLGGLGRRRVLTKSSCNLSISREIIWLLSS